MCPLAENRPDDKPKLKDVENLPNTVPGSAARKIAIGRDGETRQKNLEACKLCRYPLADPDGVLLDLTD